MKIEKLSLVNFRNFKSESILFHPNKTVFVGNNGQGKTNLLESIYYLSMGRSFRLKDDKDLIRQDQDTAKVVGVFNQNDVKKTITSIVHPQGKTILINKTPVVSMKSYIGLIHVVLFSPMDMDFFDTSPKIRRKFLDSEGSKCSQGFVDALFQYNKVLKERNLYLKQEKIDEDYLLILDGQLASNQVEIIRFREDFIAFMNVHLTSLYEKLSNEKHTIYVEYKTMFNLQAENRELHILSVINDSKKRDMFYKTTHVGVHRDDIEVSFDGHKVETFASQGQKRLLIIAIKLVLVKYIQEIKKVVPILLLDDVFSEMDSEKKEKFIKNIPEEIQIIITTTDLKDISTLNLEKLMVYTIRDGMAIKGVSE
jgi:DNA replication and repair protein RecF